MTAPMTTKPSFILVFALCVFSWTADAPAGYAAYSARRIARGEDPESPRPEEPSGMSAEDEARVSAKAADLLRSARKLAETRQRIDAARQRIREKFAPYPSDAPDLLWGKMLRFRAVGLPDDAALALDFLRQKRSPDFPPAAIAAAEALCRLGSDAPAPDGVMVAACEPPATSHVVFRPGDVVVARDGRPVHRVPDWKTNPGSTYGFWRLDPASGTFRFHEAVLPAGQPRVGLLNTAESP